MKKKLKLNKVSQTGINVLRKRIAGKRNNSGLSDGK